MRRLIIAVCVLLAATAVCAVVWFVPSVQDALIRRDMVNQIANADSAAVFKDDALHVLLCGTGLRCPIPNGPMLHRGDRRRPCGDHRCRARRLGEARASERAAGADRYRAAHPSPLGPYRRPRRGGTAKLDRRTQNPHRHLRAARARRLQAAARRGRRHIRHIGDGGGGEGLRGSLQRRRRFPRRASRPRLHAARGRAHDRTRYPEARRGGGRHRVRQRRAQDRGLSRQPRSGRAGLRLPHHL